MKVVINGCFGGFGLSEAAQRKLIGCPHMKLMEPREYYGDREGWEEKFAQDQRSEFFRVVAHDGKVVLEEHRSDAESRACPRLVEVVEEMGADANGMHAELRVVEIPYGIDFGIHEYDGLEHVEETHRTWP